MTTADDSQTTHYFDGDRPHAQAATLRFYPSVLRIELAGGTAVEWPIANLRLVADEASKKGGVLRNTDEPLARIFLANRRTLPVLPNLTKPAPPKGRLRLMKWAVAAVAAVALQIGILIPLLADNLADFIPPRGERALGEATFGHIREALDETGLNPIEICEAPAGTQALDHVVARLGDGRVFRQDLQVFVLDHSMVNAFALPGGYVVLFKGLIEAASSPDDVTGVIAHEIGHVVSRDPTRHALRSAGSIGVLGLLFGDFAGGAAVLFLAERLISAQYSQSAETAADTFAHDALARANINPGALGDMFATLKDRHGDAHDVTAHFLSHPALDDRIAAARARVDPKARYTPSMSDGDWAALQRICD